jgi:hypothetical protein
VGDDIAPRRTTRCDDRRLHMTDASRSPDTGVETDHGPTARYPGIPRWVKVTGIVVLVLAVLFGVSHLTGLGGGMHMPMHQP